MVKIIYYIFSAKIFQQLFGFIFKLNKKIKLYKSVFRGIALFNSTQVKIENNVFISNPEEIIILGACEIKSYCQIKTSKESQVVFGHNTVLCSFTTIETAGGYINLGENIIVGEYSTIQGQGGVIIENNVLLASHVHFISNHHQYTDIGTPIKFQDNISKQIIVKENTWIGINVTILAGAVIGRHCIIGSGSVVNSNIPDFCVAVGAPARVIKKYDLYEDKWKNVI